MAQLETVDVLVANNDIGLGHTVAASDLRWQTWPAAAAGASFIRKSERPDAIEELAGAIARASFSSGEPIREAKLIKGNGAGYMAADPAVRHARDLDRNLAGNRRRRLHPAERSRRRHPDAPRQRRGEAAPASRCTPARSFCRTCACSPSTRRSRRRTASASWSARPRRSSSARGRPKSLALSRQLGTLSLALRSLVDFERKDKADRGRRRRRRPPRRQHGALRRHHDDHDQMKVTTRGRIMGNTSLIHTALLVALLVAFGLVGHRPRPGRASRRRAASIQVVGSDSGSQFVPLGVGKSVVIDLPRDIKDVLVADPKIANAVVRSSRRAYIIGVAVGQTNVFFFDADGRQIAGLDIAVTRDLNGMRAALKQALPDLDMRVEGVGDGVVLLGTSRARSKRSRPSTSPRGWSATAARSSTASRPRPRPGHAQGDGRRSAARRHQAARRRSHERQRRPRHRLGRAQLQQHQSVPGVRPSRWSRRTHITGTWQSISATLRAMERAGVIRTLAEPNLTAISGETATFLAGGEFPVPAGFTCTAGTILGTTGNCQYQIQFKKFGVSLNFTPVVLSEGRISLKVMTEVSELSTENQLTLVQSTGFTISDREQHDPDHPVDQDPPRRDHGRNSLGRLAGDGRHDRRTDQAADQRPARPDAAADPRRAVQEPRLHQPADRTDGHRQPYVVRAVAQKELSRPDDGFADASDPAAILLGKFNRIYGVPGKAEPRVSYHGNYGFILD